MGEVKLEALECPENHKKNWGQRMNRYFAAWRKTEKFILPTFECNSKTFSNHKNHKMGWFVFWRCARPQTACMHRTNRFATWQRRHRDDISTEKWWKFNFNFAFKNFSACTLPTRVIINSEIWKFPSFNFLINLSLIHASYNRFAVRSNNNYPDPGASVKRKAGSKTPARNQIKLAKRNCKAIHK